eukprot:UN00195
MAKKKNVRKCQCDCYCAFDKQNMIYNFLFFNEMHN